MATPQKIEPTGKLDTASTNPTTRHTTIAYATKNTHNNTACANTVTSGNETTNDESKSDNNTDTNNDN